jgi:aspartyl-tRNA(Asn)/glutamyl-tRNA(Gln) amidotransferase subunit C
MTRITRSDVEHVARLARLDLTDDIPPTAHPLPLANVLRPDEPRPGVPRDEVLAMAPEAQDGRFRVPRILGEAP